MFSRTPRALVSARPSFRLARVSQTSTPAAVQRFQIRNRAVLSSSEACSSRSFHSSPVAFKGITPDSSDPAPPKSQTISADEPSYVTEPSPLTDQEYRECSEHYFNVLLSELEKAQEEGSDMEAEYAVCGAELSFPCEDSIEGNQPGWNDFHIELEEPFRITWCLLCRMLTAVILRLAS